jgi:hypothetical protein
LKLLREQLTELMDRQIGRVDDSISPVSEFRYTFLLESDPIQDREMWQKWMGAPGL